MIGDLYIDELINNIFSSISAIRSNVKLVALKLPKNYDLKSLYERTKSSDIIIYLHELPKMNVLVIKRKTDVLWDS